MSHEAVIEATVVGKPHPKKTEIAVVFVNISDEYDSTDELRTELIYRVHKKVGKIAVIGNLEFVD